MIALGGRIWVESEGKDRGSTFCFTLPSREQEEDHMSAAAAKSEQVYKILIIEDNEGDIMLLREALRSAELVCDVVAFTGGEDALNTCAHWLILTNT
jgi:PleD family two-component response regulator